MRTGKVSKLHILLFAILLCMMALPAAAQGEEPLTLTVEADPDCLLSEAGDMTYFRFTVKNDLDEDYTLDDMSLQGDLLAAPKLIAENITIPANDVLEFTLQNVRIEEFAFDMDLSFQLTWWTTTYAPEDEEHLEPMLSEHFIDAPIRIERFVEPLMTVSVASSEKVAREGDPVTITYTLRNDTKFDMTNITLQDPGIPQPAIQLERTSLYAGERMQATVTVPMESSSLILEPTAMYTVRGVESEATVEKPVTVECVVVDMAMQVEKYPATADGTLFRITLINDGSHPITNIRMVDEIGTVIVDGLSLRAAAERTISYTVPSAAASGTVRYISFEATGTDSVGGQVTVRSPSAYEVLPFVDSDQVRLKLTVTMSNSSQGDDGVHRLKLLFDIRNDSLVPISHAVVTEGDYFKGVVSEYASLSTGSTTFEKEFVVPGDTRSLTFVLTAMDPAQTQYASEPITLDLSPLAAPKPTNAPAIQPGKTVDVSGTIYDTDRYVRILRMAALIVLALTLMFTLLSIIFHVAEMNIRRWLPKEPVMRPFAPRRVRTGPRPAGESIDPVHDAFGYQQPAKLRYMDRTDQLPVVGQEEAFAQRLLTGKASTNASTQVMPAVSRNTNASRRAGEITAVPIHKPRTRPVMLTENDTAIFTPVQAAQEEEAPIEKIAAEQPPEPETVEAEQPTLVQEIQPEVVEEPQPAPVEEPQPAPVEEPQPELVEEPQPIEVLEQPSITPRVIETKPAPRIVPRRRLEIVHIG